VPKYRRHLQRGRSPPTHYHGELRQAVAGAKRNGRYVGICGQAPSDYPEMARFLVDLAIDSISLVPDSVVRTIRALATA